MPVRERSYKYLGLKVIRLDIQSLMHDTLIFRIGNVWNHGTMTLDFTAKVTAVGCTGVSNSVAL